MCGGTDAVHPILDQGVGLSPRVRGNHTWPPKRPRTSRSIPACAGEPPAGDCASGHFEVYPRVCGGTIGAVAGVGDVDGLSPRVRGNPRIICPSKAHKGSIPACAGEPVGWSFDGTPSSVYPRVCGGTSLPHDTVIDDGGLSPRVRGNQDSRSGGAPQFGSIPACAGEPAQGVRCP